MSSSVEKCKLYFCYGGQWVNQNNEWEYAYNHKSGVKLPLNITFSKFVGYAMLKCGIDCPDGYVAQLVHQIDGSFCELTNDASISTFMHYAAQQENPPSVFVIPPTLEEGDDAGESIPDVVPETQEEEDVEEDDEEDDDDDEDDEEDDDDDDEETGTYRSYKVSFGDLNDYFDMPPTLPTEDFSTRYEQATSSSRTSRIRLNAQFDTKEQLIIELGTKFLEEGFCFKTKKSDKSRFVAKCDRDNCGWRIRASRVGPKGGIFEITRLEDIHTCSSTELHPNHRQANKRILGHIMKNKFEVDGTACRPRDIMNDVHQQYGVTLDYHQSWRARCRALLMVRGTPEESYQRLPAYLYNLELNNPGTRTRIRTDSSGRFEKCFAALGCAVTTFLQNLRRVLVIDAAHLKGRYLGMMFLAVAMDGNNNIVPIAFGVGTSETSEEWVWFLSMLRECIGYPEGLVFMSDRAPAISAAISAIYPSTPHALCCRHLEMNAKSKDRGIMIHHTTYWKACKAYTVREFERYMNALRLTVPDGAKVMDDCGPHRWARALFPGNRYNIMTSNSAESVNALSRFARRLPIVQLMEYFRDFQQRWYLIRRQNGERMRNRLTPKAEEIIGRRAGKSARWRVHGIGYDRYQVRDGRLDATVDMQNRTCTCLQWQSSGLPCGHAIATAKHNGRTDCSDLAIAYYTSETYRNTYREVINPAGPPDSWVTPPGGLPPCYPPLITKNRAGRPSKNDRRPSRGEDPIQRNCDRCGATGHTRGECSTPPASTVPRRTQRYRSQGPADLEPHGTLDFESVDLNVDFP